MRTDGEALALTGTRVVTYSELTQLVSARTDDPAPVTHSMPDLVRVSLLELRVRGWEAEHFVKMHELSGSHESEFVAETAERVA